MTPCPFDVQEKISVLVGKSVSRETLLRLERYLSLIVSENLKYNLVGPKEVDRFWSRHILDSAQLFPLLDDAGGFLDVGSGAGFPGAVLSILGAPGGVLVEASQKKCRFLRDVSRETGVGFFVLNERAEALVSRRFGVVVSRAVAPIETLLAWTKQVSTRGTRFLFLKGKSFDVEIERAQKCFSFDVRLYPSLTSSEGRIVEIFNLSF